MGELARDLGGPRLEWISIMNREMKVKFFDHGLREQFAEDYFYVGVMCGISLIQGGQVPNIFPNEILDAVFSSDTFHSTCIQHLQQGFQVFGLLEIFHSFPIMQNLFKSKQHPLTAKDLCRFFNLSSLKKAHHPCIEKKEYMECLSSMLGRWLVAEEEM